MYTSEKYFSRDFMSYIILIFYASVPSIHRPLYINKSHARCGFKAEKLKRARLRSYLARNLIWEWKLSQNAATNRRPEGGHRVRAGEAAGRLQHQCLSGKKGILHMLDKVAKNALSLHNLHCIFKLQYFLFSVSDNITLGFLPIRFDLTCIWSKGGRDKTIGRGLEV